MPSARSASVSRRRVSPTPNGATRAPARRRADEYDGETGREEDVAVPGIESRLAGGHRRAEEGRRLAARVRPKRSNTALGPAFAARTTGTPVSTARSAAHGDAADVRRRRTRRRS
jgi:hypothetical protein